MTLKKILLLCSLFLFSCSDKNTVPAGILPPAKMQAVLWDVFRADAFTFSFIVRDSSKKREIENVKLQQEIFALNKISREDFYRSYAFYKSRPNLMQPILDSMINKANRDKYINTKGTQFHDSLKVEK